MLTRDQTIKQLKNFALEWYRAKKKESDLEDFYEGRYHGASVALRGAGIVTDDELQVIEAEAKEKAENEIGEE